MCVHVQTYNYVDGKLEWYIMVVKIYTYTHTQCHVYSCKNTCAHSHVNRNVTLTSDNYVL